MIADLSKRIRSMSSKQPRMILATRLMRYPDKKRLFLHGGIALCCPDLTPQLRFGSVFGEAGRNFAAGPGGGEKNLSAWKTVLRRKVQLSPQPLGALRWGQVIWATLIGRSLEVCSARIWQTKSLERLLDQILAKVT